MEKKVGSFVQRGSKKMLLSVDREDWQSHGVSVRVKTNPGSRPGRFLKVCVIEREGGCRSKPSLQSESVLFTSQRFGAISYQRGKKKT